MKIIIASSNPIKYQAVREAIRDYPLFEKAKLFVMKVDSNVSKQPLSLEETVQGAINRAKNSFNNCNCNYSFGIESGLMSVPKTKTGYMDVCVCAIYNGREYALGLSSAFEFPREVTKRIFENNINANEAFYRCGLTENRKIGSSEGAIGLLTKSRVLRKEYTKQAIQMALIHLENPELY